MRRMFWNTPFNGDISGWQISDSCETRGMFENCTIPKEHKPTGGDSNAIESDSDGDY